MSKPILDSPTERARKAGPLGDGKWPGYDSVYIRISRACDEMAKNRRIHLSQDHIETMADLGSGHEERMKNRLWWLRERGWIKD